VNQDDLDQRLAGIAALGEPVRRALYRYVVAQPQPVSRNQAAEAVGVARHVAKFHLDKLAEDSLLDVEYARPPGRRGPGAGRPAKLYRRAARELAVSLPERRYDLAGRLLAAAVTRSQRQDVPVRDALRQAATDLGHDLGAQIRQRAGSQPSRATVLAAARDVLDEYGYEPRADHEGLTLINCPFHALAQEYTELVCGMNLDLMRGLVDALDTSGLNAVLQPTLGRCCVQLKGPSAQLPEPAAQ
jgi:predicted ArsR family transcriptional regulator